MQGNGLRLAAGRERAHGNMPSFIHAADIHLDSPLRKLAAYEGAPVEEIRGATRRAFSALVDQALQREVDFVVISGDLYDGDWRDQQTGLFFVSEAGRLVRQGIPLYVIRGNHDAASVITKSLPLPANPDGSAIMLGSERAESIRLENVGATIHGRSFGKRAETANLAADYPRPDADMFNIGLLHTSLTGAEGHESYAPCTPQQLVDMGYQYWALGHIHQRGDHHPEDASPIVFPGNIQGRHARETGVKGCQLVHYDHDGISERTFLPLDVVRWEVSHLDVSQYSDLDQLMVAYSDWLEDQLEQVGQRLLVCRVRLQGATKLHEALMANRDTWENNLRAKSFDVGSDRVWLESLRVRTQRYQRAAAFELEGPMQSVAEVIDELSKAGPAGTELLRELELLQRKLADDDFMLPWEQLLEEARAGLLAKLAGKGG